MGQFTPADGDDVAQYIERLRSELRRGADGAMDGTNVCTFCQEGVTPRAQTLLFPSYASTQRWGQLWKK